MQEWQSRKVSFYLTSRFTLCLLSIKLISNFFQETNRERTVELESGELSAVSTQELQYGKNKAPIKESDSEVKVSLTNEVSGGQHAVGKKRTPLRAKACEFIVTFK